ncbi:MAG: hypothetical protein ACOY5B_13950 [Spirochaetota bacterium]
MRRLIFAALVSSLLFAGCNEKTGKTGNSLRLNVDADIAALLPGLEALEYEGAAAADALAKLTGGYQKWCAAPGKATGLRRDLTAQEQKSLKADDFALRTRLGCSAWYALSDQSAERDMAYVRNHFDAGLQQGANCVSVGFMQPYLMGVQLDCAQITVVDLSFRTLYLHSVLLPLLTAAEFPGIDAVLLQFEKTTGVSLNAVCESTGAARCKIALMAFAEKYRGRLYSTLLLSPLAKFRAAVGPKPTIVYMSNVPDPHFTSAEEFTELRRNLSGSGDKLYAIYHQAESSNFGLYELASGKIRTVCADAFVVAQAGRYSKDRCTYYPPSRRSFTTYFDDASENRGEKKSCQF